MRVSAHSDPYGLVHLFKDAASEWRGWSGEKYWESLEGEFRLGLTSDNVGHITLRVVISHDWGGPDRWRLTAELGIDAGQLESVAQAVGRFFGRDAGASDFIEYEDS